MDRIAEISRELHALASNGKYYSKDRFDTDRYDRVIEIAAELMSMRVPMDSLKIEELFRANDGYPTPKCDIRVAIFDEEDKILLVKDYDGKWTLPGGWCDHDLSPSVNAAKEVFEEAGLKVDPYRLVSVHDHRVRANPQQIFNSYKFLFLAKVLGGEFMENDETTESAYFSLDSLPEINPRKANLEEMELCLEAKKADIWETRYD